MKLTRIVVVMASAMFATAAFADTTTQATQSPTNVNVTVNTSASDAQTGSQTETATTAATPSATSTSAAATVTPAPVVAPTVAPTAPAAAAATTPSADPIDKKIDAIRKVRADVEQKNDDKVVEKLEKTRLEEEKQMGQKVEKLNLKPNDGNGDAATAPTVRIDKVEVIQGGQPPVQQQPAVVAPAPVAAAAAAAAAAKTEEKTEEQKHEWSAGINTGAVLYNGNITQKSNLGVTVEKAMDDHLAVEGSLTYSTFSLNNYWNGTYTNLIFGDMDQYDLGVAVKYYILDSGSRFRPYAGGSLDYIYREYKDGYYTYSNQSQSTNSLNADLLAGIDFAITPRFLIGAEFKYSLPIYYQDNGLVTESYIESYAKPLEQTTFTQWALSVKFLF